jgi:hypothetical protein
MPNISIGTAQFTNGTYTAGNSNTDFNKGLVSQLTGQDIGSGINKSDLQALASSFDTVDGVVAGANGQDGLIGANDLSQSVDSGKLSPEAQRAAILLMTNPNLLNKIDNGSPNGLITKDMLNSAAGADPAANKFLDATKLFSTNTNVLDNWESGGRRNNDRFGTAAIEQLATGGTADSRTWDDVGLGGIAQGDRQNYIDAAKTMWADQGHLNNLAGSDGIMNNSDFKNYVNNNTVGDTINA